MTRISKQSAVLAVVCLVLLLAVGLQGLKLRDAKEGDRSLGARGAKLTERIPRMLGNWTSRDEPLGPNEVTRSAVEKTLNYDDYVFRIFQNGERQLGVYVAYWGPDRMPLQKVASHTPDRCWTENGWKCDDMRFAETWSGGDVRLRPGQWRRFQPPGGSAPQYVVYWHLVGDRLYDYGERFNARPDIAKWWRDTLAYAFSGSDGQHFIRVTSNRPFEEMASDAAWGELIKTLASLGLGEQAVATPAPG